MKLSVLIIGCYQENDIERAVESALMQQTDFDFEIIIGGDPSADRMREIVLDYQRRYPTRFKLVLPTTTLGTNRSFGQVLDACSGDYIALLEGDGYWTSPVKLQRQVDWLDQHLDCAISFHDVFSLREDGSKEPFLESLGIETKERYVLEDLFLGNFLPPSSVVFRNRLFEFLPDEFFEVLWPDWFLHVLNAQHGTISYLNEIMGCCRLHENRNCSPLGELEALEEKDNFYRHLKRHFGLPYGGPLLQIIRDINAQLVKKKENRKDPFLNPVLSDDTLDNYYTRLSILTVLQEARSKFRGRVLDVGCGQMPYRSFFLSQQEVTDYLGLDIVNPLYQKRRKPDLFWDGSHIPLEDGFVDVAVATEVLEHLQDIETVLKEISRVLKPGGILFFTVPFLWPLHDTPRDQYRYTPFSLQRHLEQSGFETIHIQALGGWDASLAQMIGLWLKRSGLSQEQRRGFTKQLFPFYEALVKSESKGKRVDKEEMSKGGTMLTGLSGTAQKPLYTRELQTELTPEGGDPARKGMHAETSPVLAVVCPQVGAASETFIRKHIERLAPGRTVVLTGAVLDKKWLTGPTKIIPSTYGGAEFTQEVARDVLLFLKQNRVTHILCEFGSVGSGVVKLNEQSAHLPLFVHFHGQDASEELRKKDMIAYYKWMGQHVAGVIAVSKPMASRLIEVGIPPEKVRVVHSGIDIPEKTIEPPFTPPCRLLSVSRLVPKKGLLHLLKAFEMAKQEVPEITLDIIGEGPLRNEVEEFVAVHGLTESVRLHGQRPHDDVLNMLGQCHIFAQHSVTDPLTGNAEGLPVTVLEACGQGRPVLSTFHEGIPEAVEHGVSGYLVDEGDTGKMAEYMVRLSQDGGLRAQMGQAARAKVMNGGFSTDAMLSELRKAIGLSPSAKGLCTGASVSVKEKTEAGYPKTFQPKAGRAIRNVLFVNHNLAPYEHSGTPISTLNHALGMKAKGLEVAVLIPSDEVKKGFQSDHVDGFTLYRVPRFEKHKAFFNDIDRGELESYLKDIEAVLRRFSPDVIQVNDYVWMPGEIFEVFSKRGSLIIRNVCNLEEICHRDYPVVAEGACGKLCSGPESASKCSECYCAQSLQRWGSEIQESEKDRITEQIEKRFEFIRYLYDEVVDGVVFTEPRFREFFSKFVRIPEKKVNIIPRGFRFEFQKRGKAITVSGSELHFAFVGNLMFSKGVDVVLRAFESVAGYDGFKLHLFGAVVNDEYLPWIKGLEKRFPQKIIYHGAFEKKDLPDIARGIHVCIVPSYFDTFNRVVREMLYFGVPVLSTDFFGSSVVQDHLNGLKVAVGDWQALADRMMDLVKSPDLVHRLSTGAVNCHIAELDQEVSGLLKTYSALTPSEGMEKGCRVGASDSPMSEQHFEKKQDVRLIAFYLPQFHPIPENDVWWGKGFTEWTTVTKAKPLFPGHDQPRIPSELGFYDLRLPEVRKAQADLAREHGVYGFCYYHYWFNGKLLLERPLQEVLSSGEPDFPFCLCWANENWTRAWDGGDAQILIQQHYSQEDDIAHIRYLCCIFQDRRYIRINGKPLLLIYRAKRIPDPLRTTEVWRKEAKRLGIGELYLCRVESFPDEHSDPTTLGFDAAVEFQPDWGELGPSVADAKFGNHAVYRYPDIVDRMLRKRKPPYRRFPCVTPSWDNSPRRKSEASIFIDSSPALYEKWLKRTVERCSGENPGKIIFINAWNEWGEGNHLEPDLVFGRDYLEATRRAVERAAPASDFHPTHRAYEDVEGLVASGKENEALSALEDIVATDPTHALAHNDLGCLYYGRGDKERTLVHLEKAVALNPHHLDSLKNLADFYCAEAGRGEDALRLYLRIISDFPEDLETLRTLGSLFVRLNRIGDALPLYKKILTREPEDPEAKHVLEQLLPIISLPGQQPDPPSSLKFHKEPPLVSVLLPAFELTEATLNSTEAFLGNAKKDRVEVLLILKGSPPAVRELADSAGNERIKLLTFPEGTSLTAVLNGAGRKATGRFLAFMDHRIPLSHTWLRPLLDTLLSHPEMAAVSPKVAGADHSILEAGYSRIENDRVRGEGAGGVLDDPRYSFLTRIPSLSRHLAVVARDVWMRHGGFDERLTDFGLAMMDLGFSLGKGGHLLSYQPRSIVHPNNGTGETPSGCGPVHTDEGEIKSPRPSVVPKAEDPESAAVPRKKVLVLGVYLANQPNTAEDMISIYGSSKNCEVFQRWVGLGGSPPSPKVAEVTVRSLPGKKPKFEIMNELLLESPVEEYDYVLLSDDDVVLPENFLDHFIPLQQRLGFVIAQPARTSNSYIDHPIVQQHPGIVARETRFVEIGPVVSFHRSAFEFVFPFDLTSSMGWGYENVWSFRAKEKGLKIGIIDQTPVDHSLRKPVANYDWSQADRERSEFLKKHSHLPIEACFSVTRVIHPQEVPSCQQT